MFALVYTVDGREERHLLTTGDTTVGRSPVCDLVVKDPSISRRHARFRVHGDHCLLSDLGGRNGTFLNDELVAEAEVKPGDRITLGRFPLAVERASGAVLSLGHHVPVLDVPATVSQRVGEGVPVSAWRLSADATRLFELMLTIARRVVRWHSAQELMGQIIDVVFDVVPADRAFLLILEQGRTLSPCVARTRSGRSADSTTLSRTLVERVMTERLAILSTDAFPGSNAPTEAGPSHDAKRWFIAAPLWTEGHPLGVLYADSSESRPFVAADLDLLHALALYAGAAIEQARDTDRLLLDARRAREAPLTGVTPTSTQNT